MGEDGEHKGIPEKYVHFYTKQLLPIEISVLWWWNVRTLHFIFSAIHTPFAPAQSVQLITFNGRTAEKHMPGAVTTKWDNGMKPVSDPHISIVLVAFFHKKKSRRAHLQLTIYFGELGILYCNSDYYTLI